MAINLGKVGFTPRGGYNESTVYEQYDVVYFEGDGFVSLVESNNNLITDNTKWFKIVGRGEQGIKGDTFTFNDLTTAQKEELKGDVIAYNSLTETDKNDLAGRVPVIGLVEENNTQAVSGGEVWEEVKKPLNQIATYKEDITNITTIGIKTRVNETSTFAGWGQLMGYLSGFNTVEYPLYAYDSNNMPTYVDLIIRANSWDGNIIYNVRKNVTPIHKVEEMLVFELPNTYINNNSTNVFISYLSDGYIASYLKSGLPLPSGERVRYRNVKGETTVNNLIISDSSLYTLVYHKENEFHITDEEIQYIESKINDTIDESKVPDLTLTSKVWLYPTFQYNIFNKNVCIPKFGDNLNNYRLDFNGNIGAQFNRGYRYTIGVSINQNITLNLMKGREILTTKTQNILSTAVNNGSGVNRNILIVGDSTVNWSNISTPLKDIFDTDVMNINLIGTLGATGVKHEGRGGWTVNDYATIGRKLFVIPVSGITTAPSIGAVYKQIAGNDFKVEEVNITGGNGYFSVTMVSGSVELAVNGTLTKVSGNGDSTINYTGVTVTSANPFYNPSTEKFDIAYYLTNTSQTLYNGDWIFFQLGINDVFSITDLTSATTKVNTMISQMNEMIANIHLYNSNIRIGIVVTFPPADQDAFGFSYTNGQLSEMYTKTGLVTWQNRLLTEFDNETKINQRIYLVSAHLNLDTEYNYPTTDVAVNSRNTTLIKMQNNGVHPSTTGYAQIADMYAGLIKYFG